MKTIFIYSTVINFILKNVNEGELFEYAVHSYKNYKMCNMTIFIKLIIMKICDKFLG